MSTQEELLAQILAELKKLNVAANRRAAAAASPQIADARDLDGKYGDEEVKFNPRDWTGNPVKGLHMSQCPAEALDALASAYEYFAQKNDKDGATTDAGKPKSTYDRRSASRARGWAKRLRDGWKPRAAPASSSSTNFDEEDDSFNSEEFS